MGIFRVRGHRVCSQGSQEAVDQLARAQPIRTARETLPEKWERRVSLKRRPRIYT